MSVSRTRLFIKRRYLWGSLALLFIAVVCAAFSITSPDDFDVARREMSLRKIGDALLSQSGDSKSRVLPIEKVSENEYQIRFENDLTFQPDSLVNTAQRLLANDPLTGDYIVNVLNSANAKVAYGFAISRNKKDDIVACRGRKQPTAPYTIDIKFKPTGTKLAKREYLLGGLPFLALLGFIFLRTSKSRRSLPDDQFASKFNLGSILFDALHRQLIIENNTIDLTATETRLLLIFAVAPNELIARSRLQKEIWDDQGVIVGRSLDMFISKLRKKLEADANISIVVVRGKGYKLEINA